MTQDTTNETVFGNPDGPADVKINQPSIVDQVLDLDDFLAGDVRLAERTARFSIKPDLEAKIEDLNAELAGKLDAQGRPRTDIDQALGDGARSADAVSLDIEEVTAEYQASMRSVRMRQIDTDEWTEFLAAHKKALAEGVPYPSDFYEDLIVRTAVAPPFTADQVKQLRKRVGQAQFQELCSTAWNVNTESGVSVPKSLLSSAVLRQRQQG